MWSYIAVCSQCGLILYAWLVGPFPAALHGSGCNVPNGLWLFSSFVFVLCAYFSYCIPCSMLFQSVACQWWSPSRILSPSELSKLQLEKPWSTLRGAPPKRAGKNGRCVCFPCFVWNFSNKSNRNFKTSGSQFELGKVFLIFCISYIRFIYRHIYAICIYIYLFIFILISVFIYIYIYVCVYNSHFLRFFLMFSSLSPCLWPLLQAVPKQHDLPLKHLAPHGILCQVRPHKTLVRQQKKLCFLKNKLVFSEKLAKIFPNIIWNIIAYLFELILNLESNHVIKLLQKKVDRTPQTFTNTTHRKNLGTPSNMIACLCCEIRTNVTARQNSKKPKVNEESGIMSINEYHRRLAQSKWRHESALKVQVQKIWHFRGIYFEKKLCFCCKHIQCFPEDIPKRVLNEPKHSKHTQFGKNLDTSYAHFMPRKFSPKFWGSIGRERLHPQIWCCGAPCWGPKPSPKCHRILRRFHSIHWSTSKMNKNKMTKIEYGVKDV